MRDDAHREGAVFGIHNGERDAVHCDTAFMDDIAHQVARDIDIDQVRIVNLADGRNAAGGIDMPCTIWPLSRPPASRARSILTPSPSARLPRAVLRMVSKTASKNSALSRTLHNSETDAVYSDALAQNDIRDNLRRERNGEPGMLIRALDLGYRPHCFNNSCKHELIIPFRAQPIPISQYPASRRTFQSLTATAWAIVPERPSPPTGPGAPRPPISFGPIAAVAIRQAKLQQRGGELSRPPR